MKYLEIGEVRKIGRLKVQCVEAHNCHCGSQKDKCACIFSKDKETCEQMHCASHRRIDNNSVYFKKVE